MDIETFTFRPIGENYEAELLEATREMYLELAEDKEAKQFILEMVDRQVDSACSPRRVVWEIKYSLIVKSWDVKYIKRMTNEQLIRFHNDIFKALTLDDEEREALESITLIYKRKDEQ